MNFVSVTWMAVTIKTAVATRAGREGGGEEEEEEERRDTLETHFTSSVWWIDWNIAFYKLVMSSMLSRYNEQFAEL